MITKKKAAIFIINSLQNGGAERVVVNMATELSIKGIHTILILVHSKKYYKIPKSIEVISLSHEYHGIKKAINIPLLSKKLSKVLEKIFKRYRVILLTAHLPYTHWICRFSKYRNKILFVMHNPQFQFKYSRSLFYKKKINFLYYKLNLIAVSKGVRDELVGIYHLNPKRVTTIYNPINFTDIDSKLKEKMEISVSSPFILSAGRLTSQKRFDRLLYAYKKSGLFTKYKLIILGVGEQKEKLKRLSQHLGLQNYVIFAGWSNNIYKWMSKAKLFVCSSDYESFGMTIIEALYCNCKVVSTNCKYGPNEILINSFSNYLTKLSSEDLAKKMILALKVYPKITHDIDNRFDVEKILAEYLHIYIEAIK